VDEKISVLFDIKRLIDAERMGSSYWGITKYTLAFLEKLNSKRFPVEITPIYFATLTFNRKNLKKFLRDYFLIRKVQKKIGKKIITRKHLNSQKRIKQIPANSLYDIYYSPITPLPPPQTFPKNLRNSIKRVITVPDVIHLKHPELSPFSGKTPSIKRSIDSIIPEQDFVICISESTKRDLLSLIEMDEKRTRVIYIGIDDIFFEKNEKKALAALNKLNVKPKNFILALAQLEKRKNVESLIKAFVLAEKKHNVKETLILIANSEQSKFRAERILTEQNIQSQKIKILTNVDTPLLASLYTNARLFVYISLYEGFGMPVVEAMASGCPVLASKVSSIPEVLGNAGVYINDPKNLLEIADKMAKTLKNGTWLKKAGEKGLKRARQFTWEEAAKNMYEFFEDITNSHS
jgi:glycosyltransferase involved in cell wall biosynthesis